MDKSYPEVDKLWKENWDKNVIELSLTHCTNNAMPVNHTSFYRTISFMLLDRTSFYWIIRHSIGLYTSCHWIRLKPDFHIIIETFLARI